MSKDQDVRTPFLSPLASPGARFAGVSSPEEREEREEFRQEERLLLRDWAGMPGWKVAQRHLHRRLGELSAQVMTDARLDESGLREKQLEYRLIRALAIDPVKFVLGKD